jgi:hypothetical protein
MWLFHAGDGGSDDCCCCTRSGTFTRFQYLRRSVRAGKANWLLIIFRIWPKTYSYKHTFVFHTCVNSFVFVQQVLNSLISLLSRNTNKMQLCNRTYYSKVYWRQNMFRTAHRSSSGALNCICSLWFIYPWGDRPLSRLGNGRSPHGYINQRLQIQFRAPDDERCAARNMLSLQ